MRLQATHFVEVWKDGVGCVMYDCLPIEELDSVLAATDLLGAETIAIFKIKMK